MLPLQNDNRIPPKPWTAPIDTNILKLLYCKLNGVHDKVYRQFGKKALLGEEIPELKLKSLDGQQIQLGRFRGKKHLVLEFGALT